MQCNEDMRLGGLMARHERERERGRVGVVVELDAVELCEEVRRRLMLYADASGGERDLHVLHDVDEDMAMGVVSRCVGEVADLLRPWTRADVEPGRLSGGPDAEVMRYEVRLDVRHGRSATTLSRVAGLARAYVVYKGMAEWLAVAIPGDGVHALWEAKAAEAREELSATLSSSYDPKRLRVSSHWY